MTALGVEVAPISPEHHNPYDVSSEEVEVLTQKLLDQQPPQGGDRFVCYRLEGQDSLSNIGRHIESTVFQEAFHNDPEEMQREYGPYERQSIFFVSVDTHKKVPTGALRVIKNGPAGLKTLNDIEKRTGRAVSEIEEYYGLENLDDVWDIGTVAVKPEHRSASGGISVQLYRGMYVAAKEEEVERVVSLIDDKPYKKLRKYLGIPFKRLAGLKPFDYLGSPKSHPVQGYVPEFYEKMNHHRHRRLRGIMAKKVLDRLVYGSEDSQLQFPSRYKN